MSKRAQAAPVVDEEVEDELNELEDQEFDADAEDEDDHDSEEDQEDQDDDGDLWDDPDEAAEEMDLKGDSLSEDEPAEPVRIAAWETGHLEDISVEDIVPDPDQPRTHFDEELVASIEAQGILQPVSLRRNPTPGSLVSWMLIDGERRWRAARSLNLLTIPARIQDAVGDSADVLLKQLTFNTGKPLTPIEEARAWSKILQVKGWTVQQLATVIGRSKSVVSDRLAILNAPAPFQPLFESGVLTPAAAPIIRKYSGFPESLLAKAVDELSHDEWEGWKDQIKAGVPVILGNIERDLRNSLCGAGATLIHDAAALKAFGGETVKVGKETFAVDSQAWVAHSRAFYRQKEQTSATSPELQRYQRQSDARAEAERKKRKTAEALVRAKYAAVAAKAPSSVRFGFLAGWDELLVDWVLRANHYNQDTLKAVCATLGIVATPEEQKRKVAFDDLIRRHAKTADGVQLALQILMARDLGEAAWSYGPVKLERLTAAAKLLEIDLKKVTATPTPEKKLAPAKPEKKSPSPTKAKRYARAAKKKAASTSRKRRV